MVTELVLTFKDPTGGGDEGAPLEFVHTLNAPAGFSVTGGQLFIENQVTSDLKRFAFRIDVDEDGTPDLVILEDPNQ